MKRGPQLFYISEEFLIFFFFCFSCSLVGNQTEITRFLGIDELRLLLIQDYERGDRGFITFWWERRNNSPRAMSARLVSTLKQGVNRRLRKSKEGLWGATASEGADIKKFTSLQKIPGSSCYWMWVFCKLCSVEMDHWLLHSVIWHPRATPPLQEAPVATAWLVTFQSSSQDSVSCTDRFSLGYADLDGEPLDTKEASSSFSKITIYLLS